MPVALENHGFDCVVFPSNGTAKQTAAPLLRSKKVPEVWRRRKLESLSFRIGRVTVERERDSIACTNGVWFFDPAKNDSFPLSSKERGPRSAAPNSRTK